MKYIMFRVEKPIPRLIPIIFPDTLVHAHVAKYLKHMLATNGYTEDIPEIVSAGDISFYVLDCSGHSSTLKATTKEGDAEVINMYKYIMGIV